MKPESYNKDHIQGVALEDITPFPYIGDFDSCENRARNFGYDMIETYNYERNINNSGVKSHIFLIYNQDLRNWLTLGIIRNNPIWDYVWELFKYSYKPDKEEAIEKYLHSED